MNNLNRSIIKIAFLLCAVNAFAQDINFSSEYNKVSWPVALGLSGGITGDDGNYKRLALFHGGSISLQTGSNSPNILNSRLFIDGNGSIGIGTTSPGSLLHLNSASSILQVQSTGTANYAGINLVNDSGYSGVSMMSYGSAYPTGFTYARPNGVSIHTTSNAAASAGIAIAARNSSGYITFHSGGDTERMRILANGNVGIGTASPDAKLSVSGQVHAQEVKVSVTVPGPDYVFEKDYKLTSLEEIKNYIDQNKHLPEVPSAKEMEKNGVQLGEMNMLLLKKIEELTLYAIEMNKKMNDLSKENKELKSRIESIEKK